MKRQKGNAMRGQLFKVRIDNGTATTHQVMVRASSHEHAEVRALQAAGIAYEAVRTITATPLYRAEYKGRPVYVTVPPKEG
jgi:hypothetical protein